MKLLRGICLGVALLAGTPMSVNAGSCKQVNQFEGLIFDAGAFPAFQNMESHLDKALSLGVEKVVLFPYPGVGKDNSPKALEESFPDLVVRGHKPWSKAPAVIWPDPLLPENAGLLEVELDRYAGRQFLLGNPLRFDQDYILRLAKKHKNLWIGFSSEEVAALLESCGDGWLGQIMNVAQGRVVFTSFGQERGWENYKNLIRNLKKLADSLPADKADALMFRNAEELYNLAVNAP